MRFKTFRAILVGGVATVAIGGGIALWHGHGGHASAAPPQAVPVAPTVASPLPVLSASAALPGAPDGTDQTPLRPMDEQILALASGGISGTKMKDVFARASYKVNLYEEPGTSGRAKIDLNRNGKWDEKWEFLAGGGVKREVAPDDDEHYTETFHRAGNSWVRVPDKATAKQ